ncbi:MAG: hypothetical protein WC229_02010 [Candidatus Paceibacterota bacterium]|jgi:hypothetical protein
MKVSFIGEDGKTVVTERGLLDMTREELSGRMKVYHSGILPVCNDKGVFTGLCKPLDGGKKAIFVVLSGSEVRTGKIGTEFLLGLRIDSLSGQPKTGLVCKCGLQEFGEEVSRFESVINFLNGIERGLIPGQHEIPRTFLNALHV